VGKFLYFGWFSVLPILKSLWFSEWPDQAFNEPFKVGNVKFMQCDRSFIFFLVHDFVRISETTFLSKCKLEAINLAVLTHQRKLLLKSNSLTNFQTNKTSFGSCCSGNLFFPCPNALAIEKDCLTGLQCNPHQQANCFNWSKWQLGKPKATNGKEQIPICCYYYNLRFRVTISTGKKGKNELQD